ncbi:hypothetical protein [Saccharopolyspora griseoalba]|uniref:Uncharacterized protein n=1 Tax=Saccharopolyspora griseoalba TaxID=1431848 RepID=A0ABW2LRG9_9PSEU
MRSYAVHLLFHFLAAVCGAAFGVAGVLWWFERDDHNALYLAVGALVMGVIVLLIQALYIAAEPPERRPAPPRAQPHPLSQPRVEPVARRNPTRPDLEPVLPPAEPEQVDQETKTTALDALEEHTRQR